MLKFSVNSVKIKAFITKRAGGTVKTTFGEIGVLLLQSFGTALVLSLIFWKVMP
jgi:hypothetical protein